MGTQMGTRGCSMKNKLIENEGTSALPNTARGQKLINYKIGSDQMNHSKIVSSDLFLFSSGHSVLPNDITAGHWENNGWNAGRKITRFSLFMLLVNSTS